MTFELARRRSMLSALALSLLGLGAQSAGAQSQTYTVDIRPVLNGLDVTDLVLAVT